MTINALGKELSIKTTKFEIFPQPELVLFSFVDHKKATVHFPTNLQSFFLQLLKLNSYLKVIQVK